MVPSEREVLMYGELHKSWKCIFGLFSVRRGRWWVHECSLLPFYQKEHELKHRTCFMFKKVMVDVDPAKTVFQSNQELKQWEKIAWTSSKSRKFNQLLTNFNTSNNRLCLVKRPTKSFSVSVFDWMDGHRLQGWQVGFCQDEIRWCPERSWVLFTLHDKPASSYIQQYSLYLFLRFRFQSNCLMVSRSFEEACLPYCCTVWFVVVECTGIGVHVSYIHAHIGERLVWTIFE